MATEQSTTLRRMKTITSYAGHARFLAECGETPIGSVEKPDDIASPYHGAPTYQVLDWRGVPVAIFETRHRHYEVFRVNGPLLPYCCGCECGGVAPCQCCACDGPVAQ